MMTIALGEEKDVKEHVWVESRGKRLSAMVHWAEQAAGSAVVIVCHGFTGEKIGSNQRNLHLANALASAGFSVIRFDFAGSGESEGSFAVDTTVSGWKTDLQSVISWVQAQPALAASPVYLLGHSLGGCIVLLHEDRDGRIAGRIALAPVIHPLENFRDTIIGRPLWEESASGKTISHFYGAAYSLEPDFVRDLLHQKHSPIEASRSYTDPVLLIHGTEDTAVLPEGSKTFCAAYQGPIELHLLDKADHGFTRHLAELKELVVAWLRKQVREQRR
jgi:alpha-beta hydrolase superfamily lysophospholipase